MGSWEITLCYCFSKHMSGYFGSVNPYPTLVSTKTLQICIFWEAHLKDKFRGLSLMLKNRDMWTNLKKNNKCIVNNLMKDKFCLMPDPPGVKWFHVNQLGPILKIYQKNLLRGIWNEPVLTFERRSSRNCSPIRRSIKCFSCIMTFNQTCWV